MDIEADAAARPRVFAGDRNAALDEPRAPGIEIASCHRQCEMQAPSSVVAGYQAGFLWVAAVGIYLLLRRDIDGVQTGEVYVDQAEEYGMPPLTDDAATGIPEVAPREPARPGDAAPRTP